MVGTQTLCPRYALPVLQYSGQVPRSDHSSSIGWYFPVSSSAVPQILCEAWCSLRLEPRGTPKPILGTGAAKRSFEFDRLVFSGFVERRSPDLVRSLVLAAAETERHAKTKIE